jgi:Protein of Unknown function (DUF2784)
MSAAAWADAILLLHFAIVIFVVGGLPAIVVGGLRDWGWTRRPAFRVLHALAIGVVVLQAWLGRLCPLTEWESALRQQAGQTGYERSFIETWVSRLMYFEAPPWAFALVYTVFGLAVAWAWWRWPPRRRMPTSA